MIESVCRELFSGTTFISNVQPIDFYYNIQVYMKEDIPEHLHWKSDSNTPPILVLATNGTVILRAPSNLQRPGKVSSWQGDLAGLRERTKQGISGYDPEVVTLLFSSCSCYAKVEEI